MSPTIVNSNQLPATDADFDLQKWLKEIEGAENLMTEVETKADTLQAKVDALLLEVGQPLSDGTKEDVIMSETQDKSTEEKQ